MSKQSFDEWVLTHPDNLDLKKYEENIMREAWQQAQKVAVPDGFILVENKHIDALKNLGVDMIDKAKYYQDESHIRGFGNSINYIHKAMIEAGEKK